MNPGAEPLAIKGLPGIFNHFWCYGWEYDDSEYCHTCRDNEECRKATNERKSNAKS